MYVPVNSNLTNSHSHSITREPVPLLDPYHIDEAPAQNFQCRQPRLKVVEYFSELSEKGNSSAFQECDLVKE